MKSYPAPQIFLLLILSFVWQTLIKTSKPYQKCGTNIIVFMNEIAVSMNLYLMFLLTDYTLGEVNPNDYSSFETAGASFLEK